MFGFIELTTPDGRGGYVIPDDAGGRLIAEELKRSNPELKERTDEQEK